MLCCLTGGWQVASRVVVGDFDYDISTAQLELWLALNFANEFLAQPLVNLET